MISSRQFWTVICCFLLQTIKKHFGDSYICLSDRSMGEIRNMVFIRKSLTACIEPGQ